MSPRSPSPSTRAPDRRSYAPGVPSTASTFCAVRRRITLKVNVTDAGVFGAPENHAVGRDHRFGRTRPTDLTFDGRVGCGQRGTCLVTVADLPVAEQIGTVGAPQVVAVERGSRP